MKSLREYELDNAKLVARRAERRRRSVRRLKQRVARITWRFEPRVRQMINEAIDAWASRELP